MMLLCDWNGLHPELYEKTIKSIHHTFKTGILYHIMVEHALPVEDPASVLDLNPNLLAAFLAEPEHDEVDLGSLVVPCASDRI